MKTSLERLTAMVSPPPKPFAAGPAGDRAKVEKSLAIWLPDDFFQFALTYGTGEFGVPGFSGLVRVLNPFSPKYLHDLDELHDIYREHKAIEGDEYLPFGVYPESPGLLVWGVGENRRTMFWLTKGKPDRWPIILLAPEHTFERFAMPMTVFL